ncbi:MAG: radical SAM protein [Candidatus Sericytochromatia bacterium]|nr:radical SAM protein [Candidatus Sericytochromatia bacterium]
MTETHLRLGHPLQHLEPSLHNGPGWRVALWTQGCRHRCTRHCLNPHYLNPKAGHNYPVSAVLSALRQSIQAAARPVEGLSILGGEPFEQAAALAEVLAPLQAEGLSTMVYSGHTHDWLLQQADPGIAALLAVTDLLVDGPFLPEAYAENLAWRGSSNQRLLCLSPRYTPAALAEAHARQGKAFSIRLGPSSYAIAGFQRPES